MKITIEELEFDIERAEVGGRYGYKVTVNNIETMISRICCKMIKSIGKPKTEEHHRYYNPLVKQWKMQRCDNKISL